MAGGPLRWPGPAWIVAALVSLAFNAQDDRVLLSVPLGSGLAGLGNLVVPAADALPGVQIPPVLQHRPRSSAHGGAGILDYEIDTQPSDERTTVVRVRAVEGQPVHEQGHHLAEHVTCRSTSTSG